MQQVESLAPEFTVHMNFITHICDYSKFVLLYSFSSRHNSMWNEYLLADYVGPVQPHQNACIQSTSISSGPEYEILLFVTASQKLC